MSQRLRGVGACTVESVFDPRGYLPNPGFETLHGSQHDGETRGKIHTVDTEHGYTVLATLLEC